MISVHSSKLALLLMDRMQSHIFCTESGRFIAQKSATSGTKFGCLLVQKLAAFWHYIQPLLVQKPADLLNQKRLPSGTNFSRFIAKNSAAFWHYIRLLACTKSGRLLALNSAAL